MTLCKMPQLPRTLLGHLRLRSIPGGASCQWGAQPPPSLGACSAEVGERCFFREFLWFLKLHRGEHCDKPPGSPQADVGSGPHE